MPPADRRQPGHAEELKDTADATSFQHTPVFSSPRRHYWMTPSRQMALIDITPLAIYAVTPPPMDIAAERFLSR